MSNEQMFGIFIAVSSIGWISLFGLVAWVGNALWKSIESLRIQIAQMVSREEFERRHNELGIRIDNAHRRIDDFWTEKTDPGLGGKR